ncbi:g6143 [Coccomyxa viridis]|uniref:G6143 protein n=1 Tax=Coccomyxa viridis TaxID=1274662 RepID=A0ABP1FWZ9_9CHLO
MMGSRRCLGLALAGLYLSCLLVVSGHAAVESVTATHVMHSSEKPMAEILYAYMDKLLTVARFLENATAVVGPPPLPKAPSDVVGSPAHKGHPDMAAAQYTY